MGAPYARPQEDGISLSETLAGVDQDSPWQESQIASFVTHPGVGRVLCVGADVARNIEQQLVESQYQVGRVDPSRPAEELGQAAATFMPDVIFVALTEPVEPCLAALEALASDGRTQQIPLLALVPSEAPSSLIEEAYSRTGCDFFRLGHTRIELLARTHLLVRLTRDKTKAQAEQGQPAPGAAANDPTTGRIDLRDPASNLFSSGYFFHRLPSEISRARRYDRALSLLAMRCAEAKHDESVALRVAKVLNDHLRDSDVSSRIEPDLFVTLLPEVTSDCLDGLEQRIRDDIARAGLTVGFGRTGLEGLERGCSPRELLERARKMASEGV